MGDFALIKAWKADKLGNLVFKFAFCKVFSHHTFTVSVKKKKNLNSLCNSFVYCYSRYFF